MSTQKQAQRTPFDPKAVMTRGRLTQPHRVMLYGPIGIGKSTFGEGCPNPIFICPESGSGHLNVARVHPPDWPSVIETVRWLRTAEDTFGAVVIDTVDWMEPMIVSYICARDQGSPDPTSRRARDKLIVDGKPSIAGYGWDHGWKTALEEWRVLLAELDALRNERGTHVILLAHVGTNKVSNEEGNDYNLVSPKINKLATGLLTEWCDAVLYADWEKTVRKAADNPDEKIKVNITGNRIVYTTTKEAHLAKGRNLPDRLPLAWDAYYEEARKAFAKNPDQVERAKQLRADIDARLTMMSDAETKAKIVATVQAAVDDPILLQKILDRVTQLTTNGASAAPAQVAPNN